MRVTDRIVYRQSIADVSKMRERLFDLQRQGATGKRFSSLEEEPTTAARIRMLKEAQEATLHYEKNITRSKTQLEAADSALNEATNLLIRAKEIALSTSNATVSTEQRLIVAQEAGSLFDSMVGVANTQAAGEFVFGGYLTDTQPFQADGTFIGDNGQKEVDVGQSSRLTVNVSGENTFTVAGGIDIFGAIDGLQTALAADNIPGIQASIDTIEQALTQISGGRTDAGLKLNQLDIASAVRTRLEDSLTTEKSELIDIDSVEVFVELNATLSALQEAVRVSQRVTETSVLGG
ncbi:MAG: flagellar hook-associated protein 3 [Deltaproteobacteria bacterium]|nr:flagellar hook-associated protein 3 [Deltaproteobacteria bacterium]